MFKSDHISIKEEMDKLKKKDMKEAEKFIIKDEDLAPLKEQYTVEDIRRFATSGELGIAIGNLSNIAKKEGNTPIGRLATFTSEHLAGLREEWYQGVNYMTGYDQQAKEFERLSGLAIKPAENNMPQGSNNLVEVNKSEEVLLEEQDVAFLERIEKLYPGQCSNINRLLFDHKFAEALAFAEIVFGDSEPVRKIVGASYRLSKKRRKGMTSDVAGFDD